VDTGHTLDEGNAFDSNQSTEERELVRRKLNSFVEDFVRRLMALEGGHSSLGVFCRVDLSIFVDSEKRVSLFVNEVERGITTCLWSGSGPSTVGHVGSDLAWPLACWILEENKRLVVG